MDNAVYGNRLLDNDGPQLVLRSPDWFDNGPGEQRYIRGNEVDEEAPGDPDEPCPGSVPRGDGPGHTGGDGPWS